MALAFNLLQGQQSEWALTKRHKSEDIFGIQICGSKVEQVTKACEVLNNEVDVDFIDLNMGCPIDLVFKQVRRRLFDLGSVTNSHNRALVQHC